MVDCVRSGMAVGNHKHISGFVKHWIRMMIVFCSIGAA